MIRTAGWRGETKILKSCTITTLNYSVKKYILVHLYILIYKFDDVARSLIMLLRLLWEGLWHRIFCGESQVHEGSIASQLRRNSNVEFELKLWLVELTFWVAVVGLSWQDTLLKYFPILSLSLFAKFCINTKHTNKWYISTFPNLNENVTPFGKRRWCPFSMMTDRTHLTCVSFL